jgi:hypothetical protein
VRHLWLPRMLGRLRPNPISPGVLARNPGLIEVFKANQPVAAGSHAAARILSRSPRASCSNTRWYSFWIAVAVAIPANMKRGPLAGESVQVRVRCGEQSATCDRSAQWKPCLGDDSGQRGPGAGDVAGLG